MKTLDCSSNSQMGSGRREKSIPEDIIFNILKELPVKSLLRFKCVCKQWRSITEDPYFVDSHRIRSHVRPGGINILSCEDNRPSNIFYLINPDGLLPLPIPKEIYGSGVDYWKKPQQVEGLVCFGDSHIWNPSTRKCIILPPPPPNTKRCILGFDTSNKKYKVLGIGCTCIRMNKEELEQIIEANICTLGQTSCWRKLDGFPEKFDSIRGWCCVGGVIYCMFTNTILAFGLSQEKFHMLPFPDDFVDNGNISSMIIEVKGRLGLFGFNGISYAIWTLEDFENNKYWQKHYLTSIPVTLTRNSPVVRPVVDSIHTDEIEGNIEILGFGIDH
ncbi:hypothetical protein M9H77_09687 [Catharanthus roseus]|uniref:Uncharacterized protein n=1 Tax=Catharanthus roseus TaxID=4058 RepID=A0ACC0C1H4_CATRO|nr:hypothetical protein M9H77_09687 [Catharanthus roseus]